MILTVWRCHRFLLVMAVELGLGMGWGQGWDFVAVLAMGLVFCALRVTQWMCSISISCCILSSKAISPARIMERQVCLHCSCCSAR